MARYHAQCIIQASSGASRDANVTTFAAQGDTAITSTEAIAWLAAVKQLFEDMKSYSAMRGRAQTGHRFKIYDIDTPEPNYPIFDLPWAFDGAVGAVELPLEVQLCISYANNSAFTFPRARRRGRIYIGGWASTRNDAGRPDTAVREGLPVSYLNYVVELLAETSLFAGVWSRSADDVFPIETVWVDNEWDTMRSRGGRSTARTTVP